MKILYDHQIFTWQKFGGISRYFTQIIKNLPDDVNSEISVLYSDNEYLIKSNLVNDVQTIYQPIDHFYPGIRFPFKRKLFKQIIKRLPKAYPEANSLNKQFSIEMLKKQDFDVFHPTYYDDYFLEYIGDKPFVLTIHDMIHEIYPELTLDVRLPMQKAKLASMANHIIAVSEETKKDIINILGIDKDKISVVYHANSIVTSKENKIILPLKYFLFVGYRHIYKNFYFCVRALSKYMNEDKSINLICVGNEFNLEEILFLKSLGIYSQTTSMNVDDDILSSLYQNAIALIFPSYYEGFGLPILEAFSNSCPVLLSSSSCFPEIAGDAALYFKPKDTNSIREAIKTILDSKEMRVNLIEKGHIKSKCYSWKDSSDETFKIYCNSIS